MRSSASSSFVRNNANANARRRNKPSAESRLGLPRPSLDSMRTTTAGTSRTAQPQSEAETTDYESHYDDYDDDDETEALLSRKHGEAAVAGSRPKKRGATGTPKSKSNTTTSTDQDIANEYAEQEKQQRKKVRRNVHRTVTPEDLVRSKGLTVVRNGIPARFHSNSSSSGNNKSSSYTKTPRSMARYSRKLITAYSDWMDEMTSGLPLVEQSWKLRALGSKTQIKQYLVESRKTIRDQHVERLLGLEKAETLLRQLEDYYAHEYDDADDQQPQQDALPEEYDNGDQGNAEGAATTAAAPITNPYASNNTGVTPATNTTADADADENSLIDNDKAQPESSGEEQEPQKQDPLEPRLQLQKEQRAQLVLQRQRRRQALEDSDDDEEEALFDDVVSGTAASTVSVTTDEEPPSPPKTKAAKRHVLEDDSDDDEDEKGDDEGNGELEFVGTANNKDTVGSVKNSNDNVKENQDDEQDTVAPIADAITGSELDEKKNESIKALLEGSSETETRSPEEKERGGHSQEQTQEEDNARPEEGKCDSSREGHADTSAGTSEDSGKDF